MTPTCLLATLCLNEMEWLPKLYRQHASWPGMAAWCFVEAADRMYAQANPNLVSPEGLSVDGTTQWLTRLGMESERVLHYRYGFAIHPSDPSQGKCGARNVYLQLADRIKPDFIIVIDADEFYTRADQVRLMEYLRVSLKVRKGRPNPNHWGHMLRQRHVWYPPCYGKARDWQPYLTEEQKPGGVLFSQEVIGGYWRVAHCRVWRWQPGMRHVHNHNAPQTQDGYVMNRGINRLNRIDNMPECIHMGFASSLASRTAKSSHYVARGEGRESGRTLNRQMYVDCREAWTSWQPGTQLPHGARSSLTPDPFPKYFRSTIMSDQVLVVLTNYARPQYMPRVIQAWKKQTVPTQVVVVDNAPMSQAREGWVNCKVYPKRELQAADDVWRVRDNMGCPCHFAPAIMLHGHKYVMFADDDYLPGPRALEWFVNGAEDLGDRLTLGSVGRLFRPDNPVGSRYNGRWQPARGDGPMECDLTCQGHFVLAQHVPVAILFRNLLLRTYPQDAKGLVDVHDDFLLCLGIQQTTGHPSYLSPLEPTPEHRMVAERLPEGEEAVWKRPRHFEERDAFVGLALKDGWRSLVSK